MDHICTTAPTATLGRTSAMLVAAASFTGVRSHSRWKGTNTTPPPTLSTPPASPASVPASPAGSGLSWRGAACWLGARSSVFGNLPEWKVCVGNPAKPIRDRVLRAPTP